MRARLLASLLLVCGLATVAAAKPIWMTGFELIDLGTANGDSMELVETFGGGAVDKDIGQTGNADCSASGNPHNNCSAADTGNLSHNQTNGGHVSSHRAMQVDLASAEYGFYSLPQLAKCTGAGTCSVNGVSSSGCDYCTGAAAGNATGEIGSFQTLSAAWTERFDTLPGAGTPRRAFHFVEGSVTANPVREGCGLNVNSDRTMTLTYNGTTRGSASTEQTRNNRCSVDPTVGCVTASTDCPGGAGSCSACSASAQGNCYWAPIGVTEEILSGDAVRCTARLRGRIILQQTITAAGAQQITDVHFGAPVAASTAFRAAFDDFVLDDSDDPGWGYVAAFAPGWHGTCSTTTTRQCQADADCPSGETCTNRVGTTATQDGAGPTQSWTPGSSSKTRSAQVRDSVDPLLPYKYSNATTNRLEVKVPGQTQQFWRLQPDTGACAVNADCTFQDGGGTCTNGFCVALPTVTSSIPEPTATVTGVELLAAGSTNGNAFTREFGLTPLLCTALATTVTCAQGSERIWSIVTNTADHLWGRALSSTAPGGTAWGRGPNISNLGYQIRTTSNYDSANSTKTYLATALAYLRVNQVTPPPRNLHDHSAGTRKCSTHTDCAATACTSATDYATTAGDRDRTCGWCENGGCVRDGLLVAASNGDSTNGGTLTAQCQGGTNPGASCSQKDYCSWDRGQNLFQDHPPGGCNRDDTLCHICSGPRRDENGGYGWQCSSDSQCPTSGTCNESTLQCMNAGATADIVVPCCADGVCNTTSHLCEGGIYGGQSCATSCGGLGGTCYSTATCNLSCTGGTCSVTSSRVCSEDSDCRPPTCATCGSAETCVNPGICPTRRSEWGASIGDNVNVDVLLVCAKGGESTPQMLRDRYDGVISAGLGCRAVVGQGRCQCASDADCGGGAGSCCLTSTGCDSHTVNYGTCRSGTLKRASCEDPTDCAAGQLCAFPAPDNLGTLEGFNDVHQSDASPNCRGYPVGEFGFVSRPCDPGANPTLPSVLCMGDTECQAASGVNSTNSQCLGVTRLSNQTGLLTGKPFACVNHKLPYFPCTVAQTNTAGTSAACSSNGDCTGGSCSCPAAGCTEQLAEHAAVPIGICHQNACGGWCRGGNKAYQACTVDGDCPTSTCELFVSVGGMCHAPCTVDADCGAGAAAIAGICSAACVGGSKGGQPCVVDGDCPNSTCGSQKVCQGRCSVPSDAHACTRDVDCRGPYLNENSVAFAFYTQQALPNGVWHRYDGTCNTGTGKCACMGRVLNCPGAGASSFSPTDNYCPTQSARWNAENSLLAITQFEEMGRRLRSLGQSVIPTLWFGTIPHTSGGQCESAFAEEGYYSNVSVRLKQRFPFIFDARAVMDRYPHASTHTDHVHFKPFGSLLVGHSGRDLLATFNTCVTSANIAQGYCRGLDQSYTTSGLPCTSSGGSCICTTATDCPAYNTCDVRVCTDDSGCPATTDTCRAEP